MTYLCILDDESWKHLDFPGKVQAASEKYRKKFGRQANTCRVNPSMTPRKRMIEAVEVVRDGQIPVNYFWIGEKVS